MSTQTSPSSACQEDLPPRGEVSADSKRNDTPANADPPKPRKTFFKKALTRFSNSMSRMFSQKNVQQAVDLYEEKANEVAIVCSKAGRKVYNRVDASSVTVPGVAPNKTTNNSAKDADDATNTEHDTDDWEDLGALHSGNPASGGRRIKPWVMKCAKITKIAIRCAVTAIRVLGATAVMAVNGAVLVVDVLAAASLEAIDTLCEVE